ncbi:MAG: hypothetical protein IJZ93_05125 [Clostridia bacterium]|nr:hypothetical protein [Clostridia bacterium]
MDKKYDQIKLDVSEPENTESSPELVDSAMAKGDVVQETIEPSEIIAPVNQSTKRRKISDPQTISINERLYEKEPELDEDVELISPDADVFEKAEEQTKNDEIKSDNWNKDQIKRDNFKNDLDDIYASTAQTEQQFMSTFGIADKTGKTLNIDISTNQTTSEIETLQGDIHSDYYEYTNRQQRKEIIGMYKYAKRSIKTKMIMASIFAIFVLLIESLSMFSIEMQGIFSIKEHPYIHFIADIGFLLLCAACAYEQLYHGIKSIFSRELIPESIAVYVTAAGLLYSIINLVFIPFTNAVKLPLCNFPVAFVCVLVLYFSYINVAREKYGFSVVSSKDTKFVLSKVEGENAESEQEAFTTTGKGVYGDIIRIEKSDFVKGYFQRTNRSAKIGKIMYPYYLLAICIPLIFAVIASIRNRDFFEAVNIWYVGFLLIAPIGVLVSYSLPFFFGNKKLFEDEVSIIGESALDEFFKVNVVSANDTTAFPPYNVKLQSFNVYNDYKFEKVLYYAASGFSTVGGPLADVFEIATKDAFAKSKRAKFVCSGRNYLCVKVDNDTIIFADRYGITSQGIELGNEKDASDEDVSVMYMACNSKLCAKMYIKYQIDDEFAKIVKALNKQGIYVGIRTFDPNINNELLEKQTHFKKADLQVIRLGSEEDIPQVHAKTDSGIVSKGLSKALLKALPVCRKIVKVRKASTVFKIIFSVIGAVALGFFTFGKITAILPIYIVGYYLLSCLVLTALGSKTAFKIK